MFCNLTLLSLLAVVAGASFAEELPQVHLLEVGGRSVSYVVQDGLAITQGDIILGSAEDVDAYRIALQRGDRTASNRKPLSIASTGIRLWPNATIYYTIDADIPVSQNISDAIAYWNAKPPFKLVPRTTETNYVRFSKVTTDAACNSALGMSGGQQLIGVTASCSVGSAIHEIGHAWGLLHEQERSDRGAFITVQYENIDKRYLYNFNQENATEDLGYYDYDSIMHYGATGFARNFNDTMETVPVGIPIGQRLKLSAGDLDGVMRLYGVVPTTTTITTTPEGLTITVDGQSFPSPQSFNWAAGSQHSVSVGVSQGTSPRYAFARWSDGGAIQHIITVSSAVTVFCAQFARQFPVQSGVSQGQGTVSLFPSTPDGYLADRYPFLAAAAPANGYQFVRWLANGTTSIGTFGLSVSNPAPRLEIAGVAPNYQGAFTSAPLSVVDSDPRGALIQVDGTNYYTPVSFAWATGTSHSLTYTSPQLQGTNTTRYQFVQWEDGSSGARSVVAQAQGGTYTAKFGKQYLVTSAALGNGTITLSPAPSDGFYDAGTLVQVSANPGAGQALRYWLGDLGGSATNTSVLADQTRYVVGYFGVKLPWIAVNSATLVTNPVPQNTGQIVAPGELISIFGAGIGPASEQFPQPGSDGRLPTSAGDVSVLFDQTAAAISYAGPNQINVIVPFSLAGQTSTTVTVRNGQTASPSTIGVTTTVPGLFTSDGSGRGPVAALNQDGTLNTASNPAAAGSVITLYGTGAGTWTKSFLDGAILSTDLAKPSAAVYVRFGKLDAAIQYAGTAPYLVNGALQVNAVIPAGTLGGQVPVQIVVGRYTSAPGTTIWVR